MFIRVAIPVLALLIFGLSPTPTVAAPPPQSEQHWAYVKPVSPLLPRIQQTSWPRNTLDLFILARLESEDLQPSPPASRSSLIRRLYLDLIGLPPPPEAVERFLAQDNPGDYEALVDQLLASPHYGERWARPWLDLARYADSNGFQRDGFRDVWAYRDWVINAFNADMPFDQFTIEQLAGDLLPDATTAQKTATGFNRCPTVNVEAGTDQEANRVNQVVDRINTTATVWLGSTIQCAQCHDHKYDPVSQQEYYQLFAYFNNTEIETQFRTAKATAAIDFVSPTIEVPAPPDFQTRRQQLNQHINALKQQIASLKEQKNTKKTKAAEKELNQAKKKLNELNSPHTLVMKERAEPRTTAVMIRGSFLHPGQSVLPSTPAFLHPKPDGPPNRLTLARWLANKENPLVARVTVNRWWAEFFGHGIVSTPEDFGLQGSPPTHPQLLDHLAVQFMENGWSMKSIHKQIVLSATYRQSSVITPALLTLDPANQIYARGPRFRLDAETIRDNALAAAGLLCLKQGGPPVKPYQPPNIWRVTGQVDNTYTISEGQDRYRRGIYTVWRRSAPYPSFVAFDAPSRSACVVQRSRSNTPMQALTLLNDPVYVEAAQQLALRLLTDLPNANTHERLHHAFTLCLSRPPTDPETRLLKQLYDSELVRLQAHPEIAKTLTRGLEIPPNADHAQLAAWSHIATVLLNLDETITKG